MLEKVFVSLDSNVVLVLVVILITWVWLHGGRRKKKIPPGPMGLPIVGYLPFLTDKPHLKLTELKKKYGPVYSLSIGSHQVIVLADFPSIKEAFNKDAFYGVPPDDTFQLNKETIEKGFTTGLAGKQVRRFSIHVFRDLGLGKTQLESDIADEARELLERLEKEQNRPIAPNSFLSPSVFNNISSLLFGKRRKFDDPKRIILDEILNRQRNLLKTVVLLEFFPALKKVLQFFRIGKQQKLLETVRDGKKFIRDEIEEHVKHLDHAEARDFIDRYLLEMEKTKGDPNSVFTIPILEDTAYGFFLAGSESVRGTLDWLLLISAAYPDVQKRVQSEIDDVIGNERFPARADYLHMPYTEATIMETFRWRASLPLNFPRYTIEDTEVGPYFIPKNVRILAVTWAVHHDPELWGADVESFKPERFLSEDGKRIEKPEYYIPFSIGKRSCPGESLAQVEVFLYFTAILRKFHLRLPGGTKPDLEGTLSIGMETKPHYIYFDLR